MAIITCPKCGNKYSDKAPGCPNCHGLKGNTPNTKNILAVTIIILLIAVIIVGLMNYKATKDNSLVAQINNIQEKVEEKKPTFNKTAETEARYLKTSIELYYVDHTRYPSEIYEIDLSQVPDSIQIQYLLLDDGQNYFVAAKHEFGDMWYSTTMDQTKLIESEQLSLPHGHKTKTTSLSIPTFDTEKYCTNIANAAGGSYQTKEYCFKEENKSKRLLSSKTTPSNIMTYCADIARAAGGTYATLEFCINEEMASKQRLSN